MGVRQYATRLGALLQTVKERRHVLRLGYTVVVAMLILASVQAYLILGTVSEKNVETYRQYVRQDEALSNLRYSIWLAGNYVRDYFIDTTPANAHRLREQLAEVKAGGDAAFRQLEAMGVLQDPALRSAIQDFWKTVEPVPQLASQMTDAQEYEFVQREIAPRRSILYNALRELQKSDQANLQRREAAFATTRRVGAQRLFFILAFGVLLSLVVARLSLAHAETLENATRRHYEEVSRAKVELEQLSARLVDLDEEGRRRLARELHDGLGQTLAILQIEISKAGGLPGLRERLGRARELAEQSVQTVRDISVMLRPALLDDLGLVPALQWLIEDFIRRSGIECHFAEEQVVDDSLPDPVKTCVYRVVQEAIHNCEKHSGASRARVTITQSEGTLAVSVEDNGRGFDPAANLGHKGMGIFGMRERASRMGGTLTIDSAPGHGCRLKLSIPALSFASSPQTQPAPLETSA
jgi:signal transduction histidine kinase